MDVPLEIRQDFHLHGLHLSSTEGAPTQMGHGLQGQHSWLIQLDRNIQARHGQQLEGVLGDPLRVPLQMVGKVPIQKAHASTDNVTRKVKVIHHCVNS